jgi:hypothetical protein
MKMIDLSKALKSCSYGVCTAIAALALGAAEPASAQANFEQCGTDLPLSGTISGTATSVSFLVGYRWGKGVLKLNDGREFPFSARGLKVLETGVRTMEIEGEVYNLERIEDFIGHYYGASMGIVPIKGKGEIIMNNSRCVVIVARHKSKGLTMSAPAPQGITIQFDED